MKSSAKACSRDSARSTASRVCGETSGRECRRRRPPAPARPWSGGRIAAASSSRVFMPSGEAQAAVSSENPLGPPGCHSGMPSRLSAFSAGPISATGRLKARCAATTISQGLRIFVAGALQAASSSIRRARARRDRPRCRERPRRAARRARVGIVGDEMAREFARDMRRRRRLWRGDVGERRLALRDAVLPIDAAEQGRRPGSCALAIEDEGAGLAELAFAPDDRPAGQDVRELRDVGLAIAGADAHRVQFEDFARQILVEAALAIVPRLGIGADRVCSGCPAASARCVRAILLSARSLRCIGPIYSESYAAPGSTAILGRKPARELGRVPKWAGTNQIRARLRARFRRTLAK